MKPGPKPSSICRKGHDKRVVGLAPNGQCKTCCDMARHARITRNKKRLAMLKTDRGCLRCGYNTCAAALHFHHRDPTAKTHNVAILMHKQNGSWPRLEREIAKCDILCANCHAEQTWSSP